MTKAEATTTKTMPPTTTDETKRQAAREVVDILHDISVLLNTNLDRTQLSLCVSLIENGVNPEALANVIKDLRGQATDGSGSVGAATMTPKRKESVKK